MDSDFTVGFKQGQKHGKEIILEKVNDAIEEIEAEYSIDEQWMGGISRALSILKEHLGEELWT